MVVFFVINSVWENRFQSTGAARNTEPGRLQSSRCHAAGADLKEQAKTFAVEYTYLTRKLMD